MHARSSGKVRHVPVSNCIGLTDLHRSPTEWKRRMAGRAAEHTTEMDREMKREIAARLEAAGFRPPTNRPRRSALPGRARVDAPCPAALVVTLRGRRSGRRPLHVQGRIQGPVHTQTRVPQPTVRTRPGRGLWKAPPPARRAGGPGPEAGGRGPPLGRCRGCAGDPRRCGRSAPRASRRSAAGGGAES